MIETHIACTHCGHHCALTAIVAISTDSPNHTVRKPSYGAALRWSFDHRPRVFASTPIAVLGPRVRSRIFRASGRHEASLPRYKSTATRSILVITGQAIVPGDGGRIPRFIAAFVFARTSDTRDVVLSLAGIEPTARMQVYGTRSSVHAECVSDKVSSDVPLCLPPPQVSSESRNK